MKLELRPYQREAVNAAWEWMRANEGNPAVVIPTAGGKTLIMAEMARQAVEQWHGRVMIAAHTRELVAQNEAKLRALWPAANVGMYAVSHRRRDRFNPVVVAQVQSAAKKAHVFGHVDLLIVDECHRIPPVGEGLYLTLIAGLRRFNPRLRVIGMTATPYRLQGRAVAITGPGKLLTAVAYEARIPDLIRDGYLCPLVSRDGGIHADLTGVRTRGGEYVEEDLAAAVDRPELVEATCREMLARAGDRRAWIVFGVSVAHAEHVAAELVRLGVTAEVVHGGMSATDRDAVLGRFERREIRALVNVNVLSEGFDAPHIDMVAMLRPTKSPGLMYQQCLDSQTEILTRAGWKQMGGIGFGDEVAAVDYSQEMPTLRWEQPLELIRRQLGDEAMYQINSPGVDMRVTAGHSLILSSRRDRNGWRRETAELAALRLSDYRIPVAAMEITSGAPLTDDEIRFIGWVMTDGSIDKNKVVSISQSTKQPWFAEIEKMLIGCGFKYSKRIIVSKTQFNESAPRFMFRVCFGNPRGRDKHLSGWGRLERWVSKDFSDALEELDERQFGVLLEAIHLGDGSKQANQSWTRRSYHITTVRKTFADRLQSMCARRGWRCNIGKSNSRGTEMLSIHIKAQAFRAVGGANQKDRASLLLSESDPNEEVWCVRVPSGAFIARRNGKAFVTGNCGRGFRLHPDKANCLVLDFAANLLEHGPVDQIRVVKDRKKKDGTEVVKGAVKKCPKCEALVHFALRECPECQHQFPAPTRQMHGDQPIDAPVLSGQRVPGPRRVPVTRVRYAQHIGKSGVPTVQVTYLCGLATFREWLCFEHGGVARAKAVAWWTQRTGQSVAPRTVKEALEAIETRRITPRKPAAIYVSAGGRYEEIIGVDWNDDSDRTVQPDRAA